MGNRGIICVCAWIAGFIGLCLANTTVTGPMQQNSESMYQNSESMHQNSESMHQNSESMYQNSESMHQNSESMYQNSESMYQNSESMHQNSEQQQNIRVPESENRALFCKPEDCPRGHFCLIGNGKKTCFQERNNVCTAFGGSHYRTFDGTYFDFMGTCTYTFVSICGATVAEASHFTVLIKKDFRGNGRVSNIAQVTFKTNGYVIDIRKSEVGYVRLNNDRSQLPISLMNGVLNIFRRGSSAYIKFENLVQVFYDWNNVLRVELPLWYNGSVCGICGNFNQIPEDDLRTSNGTLTPDATVFAKSWKVDDNSNCWDGCRGPCFSCPPDVANKYTTNDYCGLLNKTDGPFCACHETVNPQIYMQNCAFDVCLKDGNKRFSCEVLKAYADICQREGVNISEWREAAGCPLECPKNSRYKLCGRACLATCEDPGASSVCSEPCVETCECDPGFILIKGQCLPKEQCGCLYEERSYATNDTFWADSNCQYRCVCNGKLEGMECKNSPCRAGEECTVKDGLRDCYPNKYGTCTASGNRHYITFDGVRYDFQGTCQYQLSALCDQNSGLTEFQVNVWNENRGNRGVSYVTAVNVKVYGREIQMSQKNTNKVMVDGLLLNLPYTSVDGRLSFFYNPNSAVISTDFGVTVTLYWSGIATVTIPSTYDGKVCGLCGNFNGNQDDDFISRDETTPVSANKFAQSWNATDCNDIVINPVCDGLGEQEKRQRNETTGCGIVLSSQGPFRDCHKLVNPEDYFKNCAFDYCFFVQRQTFFCSELTSYALACQAAGGTVQPWRSEDFCSYSCPSHSHYELCAEGCPVTCNGFTTPAGCDSSCREGCVCDEGFILSGGSCVRLSECGGSDDNGVYYAVGESYYVGEVCTERCTCNKGGHLTCSPTSCSINEECRIENGMRGCFPVGSATCTVSGYSHYKTFDGRAFGHQGVCSYILSQSCGDSAPGTGRNLTEFRVTIQTEKLESGATVIIQVTLDIYGQRLSLKQKRRGLVQVNGIDLRLPVTLLSGKVRAECYGLGTLIVMDFGLKLTYDLSHYVTVTVPGNYKNRTCGMCGNYNGNTEDDLGPSLSDISALGEKWKIPDVGKSCEPGCGSTNNSCPTCDETKRNLYSGNDYCGILSATTGPLTKCHSMVGSGPFLNECVSDLCQSNGDGGVRCNIATSYAAACKDAGVTDIQWRSEGFCGIQCPPHSHYTTCTDLCSSSCAALTDPYACGTECAEGCQCDDGYLFDGTQCVPLQECGCYENGHYYKPNETLLNDDCSQICTCNPYSGVSCRNNSCAENQECQLLDGVQSCISNDQCKSKTCHMKETCQVIDGEAVCVPNYNGTCWAWGDPHFQTFDSYNFDFNGTCSYVLAMYTGNDTNLEPFRIEIKNDNRGTQVSSFVKLVNIEVYGMNLTIQTGEYGKIQVNGVLTNLPRTLADEAVNVTKSGFTAIVETKFGLVVSYDWNWHVTVNLPSRYYDQVSGLCGNFNQNPDDDQKSPNNTQMSSITEWGASWKVYDRDPFCFDYCHGDCPTCEESKKRLYAGDEYCGLMIKEADGPFRECHLKVNANNFFDNCLYDVCMNESAKNIHCQALEVYATSCMKQGVKIYDWRTTSGCRKECYENSHYVSCGSACQATCADRNAPSQCTKPCVETCQCNDGFVFSVDKCVPISSCGCQDKGQYYQPHQEFWSETCAERCKCDPSLGKVVCQQTSCNSSETCMVVNGMLGCYATKYSTCTASGTLHYTTFDGKRFNFMGTCSYQMVEVASNNSALTHFTVQVQNDNRGNKAVSYTRDVTLKVYNQTITMSKDYPQRIKVNGIFTKLPYYYNVSKIIAYNRGVNVFLKTNFDVTVTFDGHCFARVVLPSIYTAAVNGLCGNNNEDPADDFTLGHGNIANSSEELGAHWQVDKTSGCTSTPVCPNCTICSNELLKEYKGDQFCGLLSKADGPLSLCFPVVDPSPYFEDCVLDSCQYLGHQFIVCSSIAAYVSECQSKGVEIKVWRTPLFCPLTCPQNSHYELCGNGCPKSCYGVSALDSCVASCTEGCYCDNGFILSGTSCVPTGQCGCVFEDKYYEDEEEFYVDSQCLQKCKCSNNGTISCQLTSCGVNEECKVVHGRQGCHARELGNCVVCGSSHYFTFDGLMYDFQGNCKYTLVKVISDSFNFSIEAEHEPFKNEGITVIKLLTVHVNDYVFQLDRSSSWKIWVNNERYNLPYQSSDGQVWANQEGNNVILQSTTGLKVLFDLSYYVSVWVPNTFSGITQGLCGNFNKNKTDDFHLPNGTIFTDPAKFGAFWTVAGDGKDCQGCTDGNCPVCDPSEETKARSPNSCGMMADPQGAFKDCHALVPPERHLTNCVYDVCALHGAKEALCLSLQAYAMQCQEAGGNIGTWRNITSCLLGCPSNSHYELCTRTCDITCAGIVLPNTCTERCFEGCECDPGYVFDGDKCVRMNQCGCTYNGRYLQANESVVYEDCSQRCTSQSGTAICEDINCTTNERCQLRGGHRGCHPLEATCSISAEHEFNTFDGISGFFPSGGTFVMASSCNTSSDTQFLVAVDDQECSGGTRRRALHVFTSQGVISVNRGWKLWLNGRELVGSIVLGNGSVHVQVTDYDVTIEIVDQITAVIGIEGDVKLATNGSLFDNTCGACGNFNKEVKDDLRLKNGEPASNITTTIYSWNANFFATCLE